MGDRHNFKPPDFQIWRAREKQNEIVVVVPSKAEGVPVPGAGFSPEAVPGNSAKRRTPEPVSHFSGIDHERAASERNSQTDSLSDASKQDEWAVKKHE
jgi:hypothetical protein